MNYDLRTCADCASCDVCKYKTQVVKYYSAFSAWYINYVKEHDIPFGILYSGTRPYCRKFKDDIKVR